MSPSQATCPGGNRGRLWTSPLQRCPGSGPGCIPLQPSPAEPAHRSLRGPARLDSCFHPFFPTGSQCTATAPPAAGTDTVHRSAPKSGSSPVWAVLCRWSPGWIQWPGKAHLAGTPRPPWTPATLRREGPGNSPHLLLTPHGVLRERGQIE